MLSKPPAFVGKIRVDGDNNQIYWTEASLLSASLPCQASSTLTP